MFPPSVAPGLARPHALTHRTRDDRAEGTWAGDLTCHSPTLSDTHADSAGGGSSGPRLPRPAEHARDCVPPDAAGGGRVRAAREWKARSRSWQLISKHVLDES